MTACQCLRVWRSMRPTPMIGGGAVWGTATSYLESLAALIGDDDAARRHRRRAARELAELAG